MSKHRFIQLLYEDAQVSEAEELSARYLPLMVSVGVVDAVLRYREGVE